MKNDKKAFTLIELMIVISIISILAGILVPNFSRARSQGQLAACEANLKSLATVLEMYSTENAGRYPSELDDLTFNRYLGALPTCPATGAFDSYGYICTSLPDNYTVYCSGADAHSTVRVPNGYPQYEMTRGLKSR